jgi:hypothetical protein
MVSIQDKNFVYHMGLNIDIWPVNKSNGVCIYGLHLAKTISMALSFASYGSEIYTARPGVIYGEDDGKVRCAYIWIDKLLSLLEVNELRDIEERESREAKRVKKEREEQEKILSRFPSNPICGEDWIKAHYTDVTQADIDNCKLEIINGSQTLTLKANMSEGDIKSILTGVR